MSPVGPIDPKSVSVPKAKEVDSVSLAVGKSNETAEIKGNPTSVKNIVRAVEKLFPFLSEKTKDSLANKALGISDDNTPQDIGKA